MELFKTNEIHPKKIIVMGQSPKARAGSFFKFSPFQNTSSPPIFESACVLQSRVGCNRDILMGVSDDVDRYTTGRVEEEKNKI